MKHILKDEKDFPYITRKDFKNISDSNWHEMCSLGGFWKDGDSYIFINRDHNVAFCMSRRWLKQIINEC